MSKFVKQHNYQEIMIDDVDEIYEIAKSYNEFYKLPRLGRGLPGDKHVYLRAFYRGQSDCKWEILPSILRKRNIEDNVTATGSLLFEKLAYKQHYETGTRLIDFTLNIDVALYFACNENMRRDGALFIWTYAPCDPEWDRTVIQSELVKLKCEEITIEDFAKKISQTYPEIRRKYDSETALFIDLSSYMDHGFMVVQPQNPQINNLRIQRQEGSLLICGVMFKEPIDRTSMGAQGNVFYPKKVIVPHLLREGETLVKIIIQAKKKIEILKMLEDKGITKGFLFPQE